MKVLVTGGAGFIGTRLCAALRPEHEVLAMDNLHPQVHGTRDPEGTDSEQLRVADVRSADDWDSVLDDFRPEAVVHLAAETGTGQSLLEASRHTDTNVTGTARMLDALSRHGVETELIVLASSRAVYGEGRWRDLGTGSAFAAAPRAVSDLEQGRWLPATPSGAEAEFLPHRADATTPNPSNVYAATKLAQENVLSAWGVGLGRQTLTLRLQNVYGSGQALQNSYTGVLTGFARALHEGREINVYEGGGIIRDFVHVDDVVRAFVAALRLGTGSATPIDIGSGSPVTLLQCAQSMASFVEGASVRVSDQFRAGDVRAAYASIDRARELLEYEPLVTLDSGLEELLHWAGEELSREG